MKRFTIRLLVLLYVIAISGCGGLVTFYPIFYKKDIAFNPSLIGTWKYSEDHKTRFAEFKPIPSERKKELAPAIAEVADKGYFLTRSDSAGTIINQSFVFLVKIGSNYYFDNYPAETASASMIDKSYKDQVVKAHSSYRIDIENKDHFTIRSINKSFMDQLITSNKINIRHLVVDGNILITAETAELQKFIIQYGNNPKMFIDELKCERVIYY